MITKKQLAIKLSKLKGFSNPKEYLEQYETDSEILAEILWHLELRGVIPEKVADYGAGTGIVGIGLLYLGKKVVFIEKDEEAIIDLKTNLKGLPKKYTVINEDILYHNTQYDMIVMNPPFGTRQKGLDALFLQHAMLYTDKILTMHKTSTKPFIKKLLSQEGFEIGFEWDTDFPIKAKYSFHKKKIDRKQVTIMYASKKPL